MNKILFILYSLTLFLLTFFSYAFVDPNLIFYKHLFTNFAFQNRFATTVLYLFFVSVLFFFYIIFLYRFRILTSPEATAGRSKSGMTEKDIRLLIIITCSILLFSYPAMLSFDIFNYMATAKVLFFYHENPYVIMPVEFTGDPMLLFTHAANKLALYGPGWIVLTGIPYLFGFGNFIFTLLGFKLVNIVCYLLTLLLLKKLSKNLSAGRQGLYPLILFAFNPLVLIEVLVSSHNDIVMVFLLLLSYFLLHKKKYILAILCFVVSIFIKYATLFALPIFIYLLWKTYKKQEINWRKVYYWSAVAMFLIFLLSPLREEMYPWYAVWFLPLIFLLPERRNILYLSIAFSFGLLLRYVPFMYTGNHFGMTPVLRIMLMLLPVVVTGVIIVVRKVVGR